MTDQSWPPDQLPPDLEEGPGAADPFAAPAPSAAPSGDQSPAASEAQAGLAPEASPDPAEVLAAQRDQYLDDLRRLQAEFENFRKRSIKQQAELQERAAENLVRELLPVLDVADLARAHGADDQVGIALFDVLHKEGLERLDPLNQPFDPSEHDAVMHEPGDGDPEVIEVMRAGYHWRGRNLRPAMVKVKGG